MRFVCLIAVVAGLAGCGGSAAKPTTPAPAPGDPTPAPATANRADAPAAATSTDSPAEPARAPMPDTPMCRAFKALVDSAASKFEAAGEQTLPGATSCSRIAGGPGHSATATYTCEFASADDASTLVARRDQLAAEIERCGSAGALAATRVRVVSAAGTAHLVVNVHDFARW